jgi:uncharacterized cysteine cluster protein YcgN (CxxCxxCC family)
MADGPALGTDAEEPFWRRKALGEMTQTEWESLCDGCGRCCLNKLEDEDTGEIVFTRAACRLLDIHRCRCTRYESRLIEVPTCLDLRQGAAPWHWLPTTCAYRLLAEGHDLPDWHPLITGRHDSVHEAGISVRHLAICETDVDDLLEQVLEDFE